MAERLLSALLQLESGGAHEAALELALGLGIQAVSAEEGSVLLLDADGRELVFAMTVGDKASEQSLLGQRVPVGTGLTGLAAMTGEVQVGAPTYDGVKQASHRATGPRFVIAAPMLAREQLIGVLTAGSFQRQEQFGLADIQFFARVAALAGIVIAESQRSLALNRRLQQELESGHPRERIWQQVAEAVTRIADQDEERLKALLDVLGGIEGLARR